MSRTDSSIFHIKFIFSFAQTLPNNLCFFDFDTIQNAGERNCDKSKDSCVEKVKSLVEVEEFNKGKSYTQRNCLLECQSTHTFKSCGCVPYYLPKNKYINYCGKKKKECVAQAKQEMETVAGNGTSCHCLPACFSVKYPYGKSLSRLSKEVDDDLPNVTSEYYVHNIAALHFFFFSSKFMSELKSELFGFTEILSNTGGLLSLFLGFSFLSLIELVYFLSLRLVCDAAKLRLRRGRNKEPPVIQFLR